MQMKIIHDLLINFNLTLLKAFADWIVHVPQDGNCNWIKPHTTAHFAGTQIVFDIGYLHGFAIYQTKMIPSYHEMIPSYRERMI